MRNADLEREILAANHDPAAYLVYADWLQTRGDPRGELIIRQLHDRDAQAFLDEHRAAAPQLRHLTSIVLDDNALSPKAMTRVGELPNANFGVEQNPERAVPRGPDDNYRRYVTVGE